MLLLKTIHTTDDATEQVVSTLEVSRLPSTRTPAPELTLRARLVATDAAAVALGWTWVLLAVDDGTSGLRQRWRLRWPP